MAIEVFKADPFTRSELGRSGLEELSRNLWLGRCQTCGRELSPGKSDMPVVVVADNDVSVTAALHHQRCQNPRWTRHGPGGVRRFLTTTASLIRVPFGDPGRVPPQATVVANPSLEEVTFARDADGRYRATTVDSYRPRGFVLPGKPVPLAASEHVECWLTDETLKLRCAERFWTIPLDARRDPVGREIRRRGELVLGISSAVDPARMNNPEPIKRVLRAGDIALIRVALSEGPAPDFTGSGVLVGSDFAHADEHRDIDWLPEISPYPGPSYDPATGRFQAGIGMDGPWHWRLNSPGSGVHNGLVAGPPGIGKTNMLRVVMVEALSSGVFRYSLADPLDRNRLIDTLGTAAESTARTVEDTAALLRAVDGLVAVRARSAERYRDPTSEDPGVLLVIDDAQAVLADPGAAALAERIALAGPAVCVGLVVSSVSVDPRQFGGRVELVRALSVPNGCVFNQEQAEQLRRVQKIG